MVAGQALVMVNMVVMLEEADVVVLEKNGVELLEEIEVEMLEEIEVVLLEEMSVVWEVEPREEEEEVLLDVLLLSEKQFPTGSLIFGSQQ